MKTILLVIARLLFSCTSSFSQRIDSSRVPYALLTENDIKIKNILARMGNFDAALGQSFGSFSGTSIDGKKITSQDLSGKITFVNFWFDACSPCHLEFENINNLYNRYKPDSNFQVISFTFDGIESARMNAGKYGLLYCIVSISEQDCHRLHFQHGFPTVFIVDDLGKVCFGHSGVGKEGTDILREVITPMIDSLLAKVNNENTRVRQ
jgi:peroxiredoxin